MKRLGGRGGLSPHLRSRFVIDSASMVWQLQPPSFEAEHAGG